MADAQNKELEEQIKKDEYFIEKMRQMGVKWCDYPLIADSIRYAEERLEANKMKLQNNIEGHFLKESNQ
jgi:hypothetical protein